MLYNFEFDKKIGKTAEDLVFNLLSALGYTCENVAEQKQYRRKGDIKITLADGTETFVDVKCDRRIADTYNILCEEESYIPNEGYTMDGDMRKEYEYIAIVSYEAGKVYFIDFSILKQIYKKGDYRELNNGEQINYCYLLPLGIASKYGAVKGVVKI